MQFDIQGVDQGDPNLKLFRESWVKHTERENKAISGLGIMPVSSAQMLVINLYCGTDTAYDADNLALFTSNMPGQMELEALFRARQLALAEAFHRGEVPTT